MKSTSLWVVEILVSSSAITDEEEDGKRVGCTVIAWWCSGQKGTALTYHTFMVTDVKVTWLDTWGGRCWYWEYIGLFTVLMLLYDINEIIVVNCGCHFPETLVHKEHCWGNGLECRLWPDGSCTVVLDAAVSCWISSTEYLHVARQSPCQNLNAGDISMKALARPQEIKSLLSFLTLKLYQKELCHSNPWENLVQQIL